MRTKFACRVCCPQHTALRDRLGQPTLQFNARGNGHHSNRRHHSHCYNKTKHYWCWRWRRRKRKVFWSTWSNHNAGRLCLSNGWNGREFRCRACIFRIEIRKLAWKEDNQRNKKLKAGFRFRLFFQRPTINLCA